MAKNVFFLGLIVAASGLVSPPVALACGLVYGFTFVHPYHVDSRKLSRFLLQISVVCLGFGMNLQQVLRAGRSGFLYTAVSISAAMLIGFALGRVIGVGRVASFLISTGTAVCGGSAIAAVGPICECHRRRDGDLTGDGICAQLRRPARISGNRLLRSISRRHSLAFGQPWQFTTPVRSSEQRRSSEPLLSPWEPP